MLLARGRYEHYGYPDLTACLVLAVMVLPIITTICRGLATAKAEGQ